MNELVADTAAELHRQQAEDIIDHQAAFMCNAPSVETLLRRLRVMEVTQSLLLKLSFYDPFYSWITPCCFGNVDLLSIRRGI